MKRSSVFAAAAVASVFIALFISDHFVSVASGPPAVAAAHPPPIVSISVCSPNGTSGPGSCANGFDTYQNVLAPVGTSCSNPLANGRCSINDYQGMTTLADEHSTVFTPGTLNGNSDHLFFVATRTSLNPDSSGMVVLSGGPGPDTSGQWTFDFAGGFGLYSPGASHGQVLVSPVDHHQCPQVSDNNPAHQDQTFDLNYADPGSVLIDPTNPNNSGPGSILVIYEGTTRCIGMIGGNNVQANNSFYSSVAVATSNDLAHTWPSYRYNLNADGTPQNAVPTQSQNAGPQQPAGARGSSVCIGNDCTAPPWPPDANYGRYPVLRPQKSIGDVMANPATSTGLVNHLGDSEPSAFVDDASSTPAQYVYEVHNYAAGDAALNEPQLPNNQGSDMMIAQGHLNGGTGPLTFMKWSGGQGFTEPGMGGLETPIFSSGLPSHCRGTGQLREQGSISYVEESKQYLLTFVCVASTDPLTQAAGPGAAWFYSTSYDLTDPTQWSAPLEIDGSWTRF